MQKIEMPLNDTLLVGFDFTRGSDVGVLIVGRKNGEEIEVVNAFQGDEAKAMYELLTTPSSPHVKTQKWEMDAE